MKIKLSPIYVLLLCLIFNSCAEKEDMLNPNDQTSSSINYDNLIKYNENMTSSTPNKGFWSFVAGVVHVGVTDVITTYAATKYASSRIGNPIVAVEVGGIVGAISSGTTAASLVKSKSSDGQIELNLVYDYPSEYEYCNIGAFHNKYLDDVFYGNVTQTDFILNNTTESNVHLNLLQNEDYTKILGDVVNISESFGVNQNIEFLIDDYYNTGLISAEVQKFYDLFFTALLASQNESDLSQVIQIYTNHILTEPYDETDRLSLIASMSVTVSSLNYWSVKY